MHVELLRNFDVWGVHSERRQRKAVGHVGFRLGTAPPSNSLYEGFYYGLYITIL